VKEGDIIEVTFGSSFAVFSYHNNNKGAGQPAPFGLDPNPHELDILTDI
jgi:hypothetical protein